MIASFAGYFNMFMLAFLFVGDTIIDSMGGERALPSLLRSLVAYVKENKFQVGALVFFFSSMVQTQLLSSGAFEIYVNNKLEYSKLETGRMPDWNDVHTLFERKGVHFATNH